LRTNGDRVRLKKGARKKIVRARRERSGRGSSPESRQQLEMRIFAASSQLARRFAKHIRAALFDYRKKFAELSSEFGRERERKPIGIGCRTARRWDRSWQRFGEFAGETFLKVRDRHIEAQDFRGETVLNAKFLRPLDPPLPFVLRHAAIIGPCLLVRNAGGSGID
jgi:hypothetical protein